MVDSSPFHDGERRVQSRLGVRESIEPWARQVVRACMPEEHRAFHTSLPFLIAAARDQQGQPWATLLTGPPGFVTSPDAGTLTLASKPVPGDALEKALVIGADLGLLGIGLESRRRNRVNGRIGKSDPGAIHFQVDQAFGNCPQYIHERSWSRVAETLPRPPAQRCTRLSLHAREWIQAADTFFIASGHRGDADSPAYGMDASHRGGAPGFVNVVNDNLLVFPDYAGNNHFNTIGNLVADARAGLLFIDFKNGSMLQLTGHARIDWDSSDLQRFPGARRLVYFTVKAVVELTAALPLRWSSASASLRTLRLVDKLPESEDVTSFVFQARDGGVLPDFEAGQHLPVRLQVPGHPEPVSRTYSLSNAPGDSYYRISVKREAFGVVSRHLHDCLEKGAFLDTYGPAGDFVLENSHRPIALISAGVGLTPMVSMLHALNRAPLSRPVWFIHAARDGKHHPLADEVRTLIEHNDDFHAHVIYSRPRPGEVAGADFHSSGRLDSGRIAHLLPIQDAEFYLCGPAGFMGDLSTQLIAAGVQPNRIHSESFGPAGAGA